MPAGKHEPFALSFHCRLAQPATTEALLANDHEARRDGCGDLATQAGLPSRPGRLATSPCPATRPMHCPHHLFVGTSNCSLGRAARRPRDLIDLDAATEPMGPTRAFEQTTFEPDCSARAPTPCNFADHLPAEQVLHGLTTQAQEREHVLHTRRTRWGWATAPSDLENRGRDPHAGC